MFKKTFFRVPAEALDVMLHNYSGQSVHAQKKADVSVRFNSEVNQPLNLMKGSSSTPPELHSGVGCLPSWVPEECLHAIKDVQSLLADAYACSGQS